MSKASDYLAKRGIIIDDERVVRTAGNGNALLKAHEALAPVAYPNGRVGADRVVVEPLMPPRKIGSLDKPTKTLLTEIALTQIGQIKDIGPLAWKAHTQDGLNYEDDIRYAVGDWVFYRPKAGVPMLIRNPGGQSSVDCPRWLIMEDRDVLYRFDCFDDAQRTWSWLQ